MRKLLLTLWMCSAAVCFGRWYFEAGPWMRSDMEMKVNDGSRAAEQGVRAAVPGTRGGRASIPAPAAEDDGTAQVLRQFDNGYVGPSAWAWAQTLGISQYFGYDSASQYDAAASTLAFTRSASASDTQRRTVTQVSYGSAGWTGSRDLDASGFLITLGRMLMSESRFDAGLQVQLGWLDGIEASFHNRTAWEQQVKWTTYESQVSRAQSYNYVYDTLGAPVPAAPYSMTDPGGVGPMIADRPSAIVPGAGSEESFSERAVRRQTAMARSRVDMDAEIDALVLVFGPRMIFRPADRLLFLVQCGATLNLLDASFSRTETFAWEDGRVIQSWSDRRDRQQWLWGAGVSAGIQYDVNESLYLFVSAGYDWVESHEFKFGSSRIEVDLSGVQASAGVGIRF